MRISMIASAVALAVSMSGCAVQKTLVPTGGSRADGTVKLSYEYGMFETPKVDWSVGQQAARSRCNAWGYSDAEAFGGQTNHCQAFNGYGNCIHMLVTVEYQCTGRPETSEGAK